MAPNKLRILLLYGSMALLFFMFFAVFGGYAHGD